jgi:predicted DCC family thiol-disulfide oxidoreductase YuxK
MLYDSQCRFCRATARLIARVDRSGELAILGFDDPEAARFVRHIPKTELEASWQLLLPTGERLTLGPAGVAAMEHIKVTRPLGKAMRALRLEGLATGINVLVRRNRHRLGRLVSDRPGPRRPP